MDLTYKIYIEKSENEQVLAEIILKISNNPELQKKEFAINNTDSFYSGVITHSYYCIFYAAKSYLLKKGIKTRAPEEHKETFEEFKKVVEKGELDMELLSLYQELLFRAEDLLGIFKIEKKKRGDYTYKKLSQANKNPAEESLKNAKTFFKVIYNLIE